ncbi:hypothetical protein YC2023_095073 [Brassica napus]
MAVLNRKPQNNNKENVSHSKMNTISVKVPLDSSSSIDKDEIQFRIRRRQPLKDITNLFVSASPLPSSPTLSFDPKCIKGRSGNLFYSIRIVVFLTSIDGTISCFRKRSAYRLMTTVHWKSGHSPSKSPPKAFKETGDHSMLIYQWPHAA